jgi:hypothetical protein
VVVEVDDAAVVFVELGVEVVVFGDEWRELSCFCGWKREGGGIVGVGRSG